MINHLTGFLSKCVLAFKRDNHLETSSSFGLGTFCVTNDEFLGDYPLLNMTRKLRLRIHQVRKVQNMY